MKKSILGILLLVNLAFGDFIRDDSLDIVIDTSTNLMWQDEEYTSAEATAYSNNTETGKVLHWASAISYCENLTLGGYSDWHLPNFNELYMLADRSIYNPALNPIFENVVSSGYWSSTTDASATSGAWGVSFSGGNDGWLGKTGTNYVRCVRFAD